MRPSKSQENDDILAFDAIFQKVSQRDYSIEMTRDTSDGRFLEIPSFAISCSNQVYFDILRTDVLDDWPGSVHIGKKLDKHSSEATFLSLNGPEICRYPPNALRVTNPLLKLKRALSEHSVPQEIGPQEKIVPGTYIAVKPKGGHRCLSFLGGKAFQWILESKSSPIRRNEEFNEIKHTKALCQRFFLDPRAAVRAPATVCSEDGRTWISIDFPPEGSESSLVDSAAAKTFNHPERHLLGKYFELWSHMAYFFQLAYTHQSLCVHNPWVGELTLLHSKDVISDLDPEAACFDCVAVRNAVSGECLWIIGPRRSGKRTLAHHLLSCTKATQLATSRSGVFSLQPDSASPSQFRTSVYMDGCPLFHSVRVGTAIGSLFPNQYLEKCISPDLARGYLNNSSEKALWDISREIPVNISKCYGTGRVYAGPCPVTAVLVVNWDTSGSRLTNDPRFATLLRADPPSRVRWAALEKALIHHVALPIPRFVAAKRAEAMPNSLPLDRSAVAQALVGEKIRYRGAYTKHDSILSDHTGDIQTRNIRWYEVAGEVNFQRVVKFAAEKILHTEYLSPPGT
ncbi:hypothetical protein XU18_3361 [Perkinsela sp. CCAP 1560/4]|nr:hypothetical protein XU18_3361 [Perkinsela sp. CCAP 1560/4]|eukprot:KNH05590.1 hypothetical protein XU18_3361 [Perkinsela sp. CCAP 1560/4]